MRMLEGNSGDIRYLLSTQAIRDRAKKIHELCQAGETSFSIDESRLDFVAQVTVDVTRKNYPDLNVPFHSRWRHFDVGSVPRVAKLHQLLSRGEAREAIRAQLDLVIVSVLLDAGAGMAWRFREQSTGNVYSKSEGLAVAAFEMFLAGLFSSNLNQPLRVDSEGLKKLEFKTFTDCFQVTDQNPLVGCRGRFELLKKLGQVLESQREYFGSSPARPGFLFDFLQQKSKSQGNALRATDILSAVQASLSEIWPGKIGVNRFNLGDAWIYPPLGSGLEAVVPFHKLSQWLTYSMVDPLLSAGLKIEGFEEMTALAEYRNGGVLLDGGVLKLRDPSNSLRSHPPSSELIVEWRALTVVLMEKVAERVRIHLRKSAQDLPLGKVLEGGTWWAGRLLAREKRPDGGSPLNIESDGTVF